MVVAGGFCKPWNQGLSKYEGRRVLGSTSAQMKLTYRTLLLLHVYSVCCVQ